MKKRKAQAVICVQNNSGSYFLILQMNSQRGSFWQNVTGTVENEETFQQGAKREAIEETALNETNIKKIVDLELQFHFQDQWDNLVEEKAFLIICKNKWEITLDPNEHQNFHWLETKNLNINCVHYQSNYVALKKSLEKL